MRRLYFHPVSGGGLRACDAHVKLVTSGLPVGCREAARAALAIYRRDGNYDRLYRLGDYLREGMRRALAAHAVVAQVIGDGPLAQVVLSDRPVTDYRSTRVGDRSRQRALMLALFQRGIFLNPMGTKLYLSLAHDTAVCDAFLDRFDDALSGLPPS